MAILAPVRSLLSRFVMPPAPAAAPSGERGSSGLRSYGGVVSIDENVDYLAAMRPPDRWGNVDLMLSDGAVNAAYLAIVLPLLSAPLKVVPGSKSPIAKKMADFVEGDLDSMTVHLDQHRRESFLHLAYGVYLFNTVFEIREDGYRHLRKPAPRPPATVTEWHADPTGGPDGVTQWTAQQGSIRLKMPELLMLSHEMRGGNFLGRSIFRSAYKAWWFKDQLEKLSAIGAEFHAKGIPVGKQSGKDKAVEREMIRVLKAVRAHQTTFVKESDDFTFRIEKPGDPQDLVPLINYFRTEIFVSTLNEALALGISGNQGSWALSRDKRSFALMNLQAIATNWETTHNRYLIAPWMRQNFGNVSNADLPRLEHGSLDTRAIAEWFSAASEAVTAGVIPPTAEMQRTAYELLDVPLPEPEDDPVESPEDRASDEPVDAPPSPTPADDADKSSVAASKSWPGVDLVQCKACGASYIPDAHVCGGAFPNRAAADKWGEKHSKSFFSEIEGTKEREALSGYKSKILEPDRLDRFTWQPGDLVVDVEGDDDSDAADDTVTHAAPTDRPRLESLVKLEALGIAPDFVRMAEGMDRGQGRIRTRVAALQKKTTAHMATVGARIAARGPAGAGEVERYLAIPYAKEAAVFEDELGQLYDLGIDEVGSEIEGQGGRYARPDAARQDDDGALLSGMALAAGALLASRMAATWADEVMRQIATGAADKAALLGALDKSGTALLDSLSGQYVSRALGQGRGAGIEANAGQIEKLVNTEAMDGGTCQSCADVDGVEIDPADTAQVARYAPYVECEGGDRCRGALIPVVKSGGGE